MHMITYCKNTSGAIYQQSWRDAGAGRDETKKDACDDAFKSMTTIASSLSSEELKIVSRAFAHFCAIANAAE
eukprot:scaffold8739_cov133-Chaetoceros_neogracile.AAC.1